VLKLFVGALAGPEPLLDEGRAHREAVERFRAELQAIDAEPPRAGQNDMYRRLTRRYGLAWADFAIAWAKAAERELAQATEEQV